MPEEHQEAIAREEEKHGSFLRIPLKVPNFWHAAAPSGPQRRLCCMLPPESTLAALYSLRQQLHSHCYNMHQQHSLASMPV